MPYKCRAQTSCRAAGSLDTVLLNYGITSDYLVTESGTTFGFLPNF